MAVQSKATLKGYFETGKTPTQQQFAELIDSTYNEVVSQKKITVTSQTNVNFAHKLGKYPCIVAVRQDGMQEQPVSIKHPDKNTCLVNFANPFTGTIAAS